jgi:hypothetical protein
VTESFEANMGGTEIYLPLKEALELDTKIEKKVFFLTDGEVSRP